MGGCASRPKDLDVEPEAVPKEAPGSPVKAEAETAAQVSFFSCGLRFLFFFLSRNCIDCTAFYL